MLTTQQIAAAKSSQPGVGSVNLSTAMTPEQAHQWISAQPQKSSSYLGDIGAAAQAGIGKIGEGINEANPTGPGGVGGLVTGVGKILGGAAETISSPIAPIMSATVGKGIQAVGDKIGSIPAVQKFANSPAGHTTSDIASTVGDYANAAGIIAGVEGAVAKAPSFVDSLKNLSTPSSKVPTEAPPLNEAKVTDLYTRAIRPTVAGKSNAAQAMKANTQVVSGLKAIADNKPNLSFTNADGETVTNALPKSVEQLNQSIGQTKQSIFKQYDALAKQAGEKGVVIDTPKIATELDSVVNSKSLALANPGAIKYAQEVQQRFSQAGGIDAQTAQDVIAHYNESLKAFYRNPSYDTASHAGIDALLANKLREALDKGISGATGEQYQALKNQYGALSSMEKDVTHRATVWARQNNVGLGANISNVASGAELVRGLLTMNPTDIAVSGAIKGIQKYVQYLNNPDVQISKIFSEIEKSGRSSTGSMSAPIESKPVSSASPEPTTAATKSQPLTKGSVKLPDTSPNVSPENVAKMMDDTDFHTLKQYINNPSDINIHMHADPIIQGMKIGKLPHAEQIKFIKEALDTYETGSTQVLKASEL